jgi:hypothetical protein
MLSPRKLIEITGIKTDKLSIPGGANPGNSDTNFLKRIFSKYVLY